MHVNACGENSMQQTAARKPVLRPAQAQPAAASKNREKKENGEKGIGARGRNRTGTVFPPRDFKSLASTNFATRAGGEAKEWRLEPESNRRTRLCRPLYHHSTIQPLCLSGAAIFPAMADKNKCFFRSAIARGVKQQRPVCDWPLGKFWSGKRDSNSRPQPWQGCALPTELFPL